ncbi:unnamed protein product [Ilex paraguariensis]|uniref:Glycosyltransferase N-terminal domain-containing protein n=1 Tax=Ilex paraguariensis TaxID=185542 RepID=A0ABC8RP96_9AQUA
MEQRKENIVMFPFMAQGHIIPFLALALELEQKVYTITFVNTPLNIKKLRSSLSSTSTIRLHEIPFNSSDHGLPPRCQNTDVLPHHLITHFLTICPSLEPSFRKLLSDLIQENGGVKPLCVIGDFFFGWSAGVAHEFGVFHAIFSGRGGFGLACYYSTWLNLPHKKTDSSEFTLPDFPEAGKIHRTQLTPSYLSASDTDPSTLFQWKNLPVWSNSDGFLFNTWKAELELLKYQEFLLMEKIELVMSENERGHEIRTKACEVQEMIKDSIRDEEEFKGSSVKAMDEFFKAVLLMKENN